MQKTLASLWSQNTKTPEKKKAEKREREPDKSDESPRKKAAVDTASSSTVNNTPVVTATKDEVKAEIKQEPPTTDKQEPSTTDQPKLKKEEGKQEEGPTTTTAEPPRGAQDEEMSDAEDSDIGVFETDSEGDSDREMIGTKMKNDDKDKPEGPTVSNIPTPTKKATPSKKKGGVGVKKDNAVSLAKKVRGTKYDPIKDACFKKGDKVPYAHITDCFEKISQVSSRLEVTLLLCNCFRSIITLSPDDLLASIYVTVNKLGPANEGLELGVGDSLLIKSIANSSGKHERVVKESYADEGDLGLVAQACQAKQTTLYKPPPLTIRGVFGFFKDIAKSSGKDSMKRRTEIIQKMLVASKGTQAQFIVRALQGKLRIGLAEQTVLSSLAIALLVTPPEGVEDPKALTRGNESLQNMINHAIADLKRVYSEVPSYDLIVPKLLSRGVAAMNDQSIHITPGLPVLPMLAKPSKGVTEVLKRFDGTPFTCEYKYDGERAQIHYDSSKAQQICIYSRNLENHTTKYPDLMQLIPKVVHKDVTSFILDSEVVAYDAATDSIKPFQALQHRGRKNIQLEDVKIPVALFAFDLLYLNGESLLQKPFGERRANLHKSFDSIKGQFFFATYKDLRDPQDIQDFLGDSIKDSCEGLMVKTLWEEATYTPSKRSHNWLKVKKDYVDGLGDSVDLIPIGGYLGKGKRVGWYGGFLLGCYDEENETIQTLCKIGTGFTEVELEKFHTMFQEHVREGPKSYYNVSSSLAPDVWFEDNFVWEVKAADLSISPVHTAGCGQIDPEKGIALRFPRFMRVREDKKPVDATSSTQICEMYLQQAVVQE